ncbi:ABC transporter substrate-binding protein [Bordetella genomosp. 10]|uniref:ABC transporter substrate-binding protein n=1 Tax=Bordetella genomosp. 10 TaxID=1416804 RepID=A0A261SKA3_9BORD|nr:tripartite tricarboxylate transporter substrate binding protein [Bordetella genomosp. 10]OZI37372.1 ABC transporter substrate-binding protein [Bordetella genomosp. 10]
MIKKYRRTLLLSAAALAVLTATATQAADQWPSKPVRIVVPFAAGGGSDFEARFIASKLSGSLGQSIVVENKPGAGGNLGAEYGVRAAPDGYTLTLIASSYTVNPSVFKLKFDPVNDIAPIVRISQGPLILVANPKLPAKTFKEFIALAKAEPGKITFASSGTGSIVHAAGELLNQRAGIKLRHIPYKGTGPALADTLSGTVDVFFSSAAAAIPMIQSGKLRALAVTTAERIPTLPDVPTVQESGVPDYAVPLWHGLIAPKGTPPEIVEKINAAVNSALQSTDLAEKLKAEGLTPAGGTSAEFASIIKNEVATWHKLSSTVALKAD